MTHFVSYKNREGAGLRGCEYIVPLRQQNRRPEENKVEWTNKKPWFAEAVSDTLTRRIRLWGIKRKVWWDFWSVGGGSWASQQMQETDWRGGWNRIMKERMSRRRSENTKLLPGYSLPLQWVFIPLFWTPVICSRMNHGDHLDWWRAQSTSRAPSRYKHGRNDWVQRCIYML